MNETALLGLMLLLAGDFNNNEQVWQQGLDGDEAVARTHFSWQRLVDDEMSLAIGPGQSAGGPEWTFEFRLEEDGSLVSSLSGHNCAYVWSSQGQGQAFLGVMQENSACPDALPASWKIDQDWLVAGADAGEDVGNRILKARRVTYYKGWIALSRRHFDETAEADDYIYLSGLHSHDEGFITSIVDPENDSKPTGYAVELARLTYQNTRTSVLKLGIIDEATGETLSYAWANPHAARIGINLRWVQCGWTRDDDYSQGYSPGHSPRSGATSSPSATR